MCRNPAAYGQATATRMCWGDWSCEVGLQVEARGPGHDTSRFALGLGRRICIHGSRRERAVPPTGRSRTSGREREPQDCGEHEEEHPQERMDGGGSRGRMNGNLRRVPGPHAPERVPVREASPDMGNRGPSRRGPCLSPWSRGQVRSLPEARRVEGTVAPHRPADGSSCDRKPMRSHRRRLLRDGRGRACTGNRRRGLGRLRRILRSGSAAMPISARVRGISVFVQLTGLHLARKRAEGGGIAPVRIVAHRRLGGRNRWRGRRGTLGLDLAHLTGGRRRAARVRALPARGGGAAAVGAGRVGRRGRSRGQQRQRVDVALRIVGMPHAEVDVRNGLVHHPARPHCSDRVSLDNGVTLLHGV